MIASARLGLVPATAATECWKRARHASWWGGWGCEEVVAFSRSVPHALRRFFGGIGVSSGLLCCSFSSSSFVFIMIFLTLYSSCSMMFSLRSSIVVVFIMIAAVLATFAVGHIVPLVSCLMPTRLDIGVDDNEDEDEDNRCGWWMTLWISRWSSSSSSSLSLPLSLSCGACGKRHGCSRGSCSTSLSSSLSSWSYHMSYVMCEQEYDVGKYIQRYA